MQEGGQRRQKKRQQTKWIGKKAHTKKYIIRTAHRTGDGRNGNDTLHADEKGLLQSRRSSIELPMAIPRDLCMWHELIQHAVR